MKIEITKEQIEKTLGYGIEDFSLHPYYKDGLCTGLEICATPTVTKIEIPMEVTITMNR